METAVTSDPSAPAADGTCFFDQLPRELRDEVYRIAYARKEDCQIVMKTARQRRSRRPLRRQCKPLNKSEVVGIVEACPESRTD